MKLWKTPRLFPTPCQSPKMATFSAPKYSPISRRGGPGGVHRGGGFVCGSKQLKPSPLPHSLGTFLAEQESATPSNESPYLFLPKTTPISKTAYRLYTPCHSPQTAVPAVIFIQQKKTPNGCQESLFFSFLWVQCAKFPRHTGQWYGRRRTLRHLPHLQGTCGQRPADRHNPD